MTTEDEDRAEDEMLDRLLAGESASSPDEQKARQPYEALVAQIRAHPKRAMPADMRDRVRAGWKAERASHRRRRVAIVAAAAVAVAAALILLVLMRRESPPAPLVAAVVHAPDGVTRRADPSVAVVGDRLHIVGRRGSAHTELWIYRDRTLIARCPVDRRCRGLDLELSIDRPGHYLVAWVSGAAPLPDPNPGGFDADGRAVREAGSEFTVAFRTQVTR